MDERLGPLTRTALRRAPETPLIRILPDSLVNKIAAGEVVERPASVLKELIENSLDAGATEIEIEIRDSDVGQNEIRVTDNGCGMDRNALELAPARHATSKLTREEDLHDIRTFGFRGEALAAIAAVSRLQICTRNQTSAVGYLLKSIGGGVFSVIESAAPLGTEVRVRDLFHNVPARRKFLKKSLTEWGYMQEVIIRAALFQEGIGFKLLHNGRLVFRVPHEVNLLQRLRILLKVPDEALIGIDSRMDLMREPTLLPELYGYVSPAFGAFGNRERLYTFVNGRAIRDRGVNHAILTAYRELAPHGQYPLVVVNLLVPPGTVDVNVHPAKTEVRFEKPSAIYSLVLNHLRKALAETPADNEPPKSYQLSASSNYVSRVGSILADLPVREGKRPFEMNAGLAFSKPSELSPFGGNFSELRVIGQWLQTYLICEAETGESPQALILIDQHAAHERIGYERLKNAYKGEGRLAVQQCLLPEQLEVSALELGLIEEFAEDLQKLGFEVETFGGNTILVRSIPALLKNESPQKLLRALLHDLERFGQSHSLHDRIDRILMTLSCHTMVRAHHHLEKTEIEALLGQLDTIDFSAKCPHGRPIMLRFPLSEIERRFGRT